MGAPSIVDVRVSSQQADFGHSEISTALYVSGGEGRLSARLYVSKKASFKIRDCIAINRIKFVLRGQREGEDLSLSPMNRLEITEDSTGAEVSESIQFLEQLPEDLCVFQNLTRVESEEQLTYFHGMLQLPINSTRLPLFYRITAVDQQKKQASWPSKGSKKLLLTSPVASLTVEAIRPQRAAATQEHTMIIKGVGWYDIDTLSVYIGEQQAKIERIESAHLLSLTIPTATEDVYGQYVDVMVQQGQQMVVMQDAFFWVAPPVIRSVTPNMGPFDQMNTIILEGEFSLNTEVFLDETPINSTQLDQQHIVLEIPKGEIGVVEITVVNEDNQSTQATFTRTPPPILEEITPSQGPDQISQWVLLKGQNLKRPGQVWFGNKVAKAVEVNDEGTLARVLTPISSSQQVNVHYVNPDEQQATLPQSYRFIGVPTIDEVTPAVLSRCGGGISTLIGHDFTLDMQVYVQGLEAEVLSVNDEGTEARIRVSSGGAGQANVDIIGADGRSNQYQNLFTYGIQPLIEEATPNEVPIWGGTFIRVSGSDLSQGSQFEIEGIAVESTRFISDGCDSLVEIRVPAQGQERWYTLQVLHPNGIQTELVEAIFYVKPELTPAQGLKAGYTNVVLSGLDLRAGLSVLFNGIVVDDLIQISEEQWLFITPETQVGDVEVSIFNRDGRGITSEELYTAYQFVDEGTTSLNAQGDCNDIEVADLNRDGAADIVLAMGSSSPVGLLEQADYFLLNDGTGQFPQAQQFPRPYGNGMNVEVADLNRDSFLDVLMINLFSDRDFVWLNNGQAQFTAYNDFPRIGPHYDGGIFDADGDGDLDVFLMQTGDEVDNQIYGPEQLFLYENGTWVERSDGIDFNLDDVHDHDMHYADLNHDHLIDVVIVVDNLPGSFPGASNRILLNRGNGVFERIMSDINFYPGDWLDVALADINGDSHVDIILPQDYIEGVSIANTPPIAMFWGDGNGRFTDESDRVIGMPPLPAFGAMPADLDQDGDLDLMVAVYGITYSDGTIEPFESVLLLNDGSGQLFEANASFERMSLTSSAHFASIDLDADGDFDMIECAAENQSRIWRQKEN